MDPIDVEAATELLKQAGALVVAAGAGMGVDSGLPEFRGDTGLWRAYPPLKDAGIRFEQIASPRTFDTDPRLAWGFYGHRLALYRQTKPHRGFEILRRWEQRRGLPTTVFTSNVDGQFQRAGFRGRQIHECHGSIHWLQCTNPCSDEIWSADDLDVSIDAARCRWLGELPTCPHCGAVARPNILMFNDGRWVESRTAPQDLQQRLWLDQVRRPVVVEIGAGVDIQTVRWFSGEIVRRHGGKLVRINPRECSVRPGDGVGLAAGAVAALEAIDSALDSQR